MRKVLGLSFAMSLLIPMGVWSAAPADALTSGCKKITGTVTFSPGLPILGSGETVMPTVHTTSLISLCSGGGVKYGRSSQTATATKGVSCDVANGTATGTQKITWTTTANTKVTSTAKVTLSAVAGQPLESRMTSRITAGRFKGTATTVILKATSLQPAGACVTVPLTKLIYASIKPPVSIRY